MRLLLLSCLFTLALTPGPLPGQARSSTPAPTPPLTFTGCLGEAGVEVVLRPRLGTWATALAQLGGEVDRTPIDRARTDEDGCFVLEAAEPTNLEIATRRQGVWLRRPVDLRFTDLHLPLSLPTLEPVTLRVTGQRGEPLAEAMVAWTSRTRDDTLSPGTTIHRTGRNGQVSLRRLADSPWRRVWVTHSDHLATELPRVRDRSLAVALAPGVRRPLLVADAEGRPVADAVVLDEDELPLARTGEDGTTWLAVHPRAGREVTVWAPGARWQGVVQPPVTVSTDPAQPSDPFVVELEPLPVVSGRVVDAITGKPVADAVVWALSAPETLRRTDEKGRFELATAPDERIYATAERYELVVGSADDETLELTPTRTLTGLVRDEQGTPVPGVEIRLERPRGRATLFARTADDGGFQVASLAVGVYQALFEHDDYARHEREIRVDDETRPVEVTLERGCRGHGRVVGEDEAPIAAARVRLVETLPSRGLMEQPRERAAYEAETAADGRFVFTSLTAGAWDLAVEADDRAPAKVVGIEVPEPCTETDLGTLVLSPGAVVEGVVRDVSGRPIVEALISSNRLSTTFGDRSFAPQRVYTDTEGRFQLTGLTPERPRSLEISRQGFESRSLEIVPPLDEPLEIELAGLGSIRGRARSEDGEELDGLWVNARSGDGQYQSSRQTLADGDFVIEDLPAGTYQVAARAEGFLPGVVSDVEVVAGETTSGVEVTLRRGITVTGVVTGPDGSPIAGATVSVDEGWPRSPSEPTAEDGRYRLEGLEPGHRVLVAHHRDHRPGRGGIDVRADGANELDLELQSAWAIRGVVVDDTRVPVAGARVSLVEVGGDMASGRSTEDDGGFVFPRIADGRYRLEAQSADGDARGTLPEPIVIAGADVEGVELVLEETAVGRVKGVVHGVTIDEIPDLQVFALSEALMDMRQAQVDYEGQFEVDGLRPGPWLIWAWREPTQESAQKDVTIDPGAEVWVELDLTPTDGHQLTGVVTRGGAPAVAAQVGVIGLDLVAQRGTVTDPQGRFHIDGLESGSYEVQVAGESGGWWRETLAIDSSRNLEIELRTIRVSGRVTTPDGTPVARAQVRLEPVSDARAGWNPHQATSDDNGRYVIGSAPPGEAVLHAEKTGYAAVREPVLVAERDLERDLVLEPTRGLRLRVVRADGARVERVTAAVLDPAGVLLTSGTRPVADGVAVLDTVGPGRYRVLVTTSGTGVTELVATVPGPTSDVVLPVGGSVALRVPALTESASLLAVAVLTTPDGRPHLVPETNELAGPAINLYAGRALVDHLAVGVWTVTVSAGDREWRGQVRVTPGATAELVLE